jgi:hypothetical protein
VKIRLMKESICEAEWRRSEEEEGAWEEERTKTKRGVGVGTGEKNHEIFQLYILVQPPPHGSEIKLQLAWIIPSRQCHDPHYDVKGRN